MLKNWIAPIRDELVWAIGPVKKLANALLVPGALAALLLGWLGWGVWAPQLAAWSTGAGSEGFSAGAWGDSYGALNALVGSLGFVAVIATLRFQAKALKQQQDDLHKQRFESSFYELLRLLRECREAILHHPFNNAEPVKGIEGIDHAVNDILSVIPGGQNPEHNRDYVSTYAHFVHLRSESTVGPYFRVIYRILERLRRDEILNWNEKLSYSKLLRGQLSSSEIILMGLNGKCSFAKDLDRLIVTFRMLKYMPKSPIRDELEMLYPREAFLGHPED
jgi:hypothetical protein